MFSHTLLFPPRCAAKRSFNSLFLLLSLLRGKDQGCEWLFSPMVGLPTLGQPWSPLLGRRRYWPEAHRPQTPLMAVNPPHDHWAIFIENLVLGGAKQFSRGGKGQLPNAGCLKCQNMPPCSVPHCMGSSAAGGRMVVSAAASLQDSGLWKAASFCKLLAVSSSPSFVTHWAMLRSISNYKVKRSQKKWTETELWKSQQLDVRGQPA